MQRTPAVVAVLVALLAAAAWFAFASRMQPPPANGDAAADPAAAAPAAPAADPVEASAARPAAAAPRPERTMADPAAAEPVIAGDAQWVEVTIVDAATQERVPDATVDWRDASWRSQQRLTPAERQQLVGRPDLVAQRSGRHARSDANGRVRLAVVTTTSVHAYHDGRYGSLLVSRNAPQPPDGFRLLLHADRTLRAQVVDCEGEPAAGVPVAIAVHAADGRFLRRDQRRTSAAPNGIAEFAHLQDHEDRLYGAVRDATVGGHRVRLWIPGLDDPGVPFDCAAPPAEPVVLRLPPCGTVRLRVTWRGVPVPMPMSLGLLAGNADVDRDVSDAWQEPAGADGWAVFALVPIGRRYLALARQPETFTSPFDGPVAAGQCVDVDMPVPEGIVLLTGRLLDDVGRPLSDANVTVDYQSAARSGGSLVQTDGGGRFLFSLGKRSRAELRRFVLTCSRAGQAPLQFVVAPDTFEVGVNDLGDLRPDTSPLVVEGRWIASPALLSEPVRFAVQRFDETTQRWEFVTDLAMLQPGDGTFRVRGAVPAGRLRLVFPARQHLPVAPVEFVAGQRDLCVPLDAGETLTVTALLDELPPGVLAQLRPANAAAGPVVTEGESPATASARYEARSFPVEPPRCRFHWGLLPRGTYSLSFRAWGWPTTVRTIDDVQVPGPPDGDPRLRDIDLRGAFATLALHVDVQGGAVRDVLAFAWPLADGMAEALRVRDGELRAPIPGPVDLVVAAESRVPQVVRGARGDLRVALPPWPEVELVFPGLPELPPGVRLQAWLQHGAQGGDAGYRFLGADWNSSRSSLFTPPVRPAVVADGRARLPAGDEPAALHLQLRGDGERVAAVQGAVPATIAAGPAPIVVRIPEAFLAQALQALDMPAAARDR